MAQKTIKSSGYQFSNVFPTIAIVPYFDKKGNPEIKINEIFKQTFSKGFDVRSSEKIIHNLSNHSDFNEIARQNVYRNFPSSFLKKNPNLFEHLTDVQIDLLKKNFLFSDLLIIGSALNSKEITKVNGTGNVTTSGSISIFDLKTGAFILHISHQIKEKFDRKNTIQGTGMQELIASFYQELKTALNEN